MCHLNNESVCFLIIFSLSDRLFQQMNDREQEFPFEEFIGALQDKNDLKKDLQNILNAFSQQNIYWIYSSISTIVQIIKGKQEEPSIKCRSLQAIRVFIQTCEYPVLTLVEVYLLPLLYDIAGFKAKKSDDMVAYYFQQTQAEQDSQQIKKLSLEYVNRAIELINVAAKIKTFRTVSQQQIKQQSGFTAALGMLKEKGIEPPKNFTWTPANSVKQLRKLYVDKLSKFEEQSQPWTQFLLVNLMQQVQSNKKQLLQIRQMLQYGQGYLTSAVINLCEDELTDLSENFQLKRKYLGVLNELVRYGDIEAVIMIKNSQFIPSIVAHFSKIAGNLGINQGQNIYPEVKASKQAKKEFYVDFLRCLETWANSMSQDYDSEEYTLKNLYKHLKEDKKFKFPDNIHLNRYQKEMQDNMIKNKQRNQKLIEILENIQESKQSTNQNPLSKVSNILQRTTLLPPAQLQNRLQQAKKAMKDMFIEANAEQSFKILTNFKENWITYLQALDLEAADEGKLENLILAGQKCVQQIQLITPFYLSYTKGKLAYRDFKERMKEVLDLHNEISINHSHSQLGKSKSINLSKDIIASKLAKSKMGNSKLGGKQLMDKIKAKSKFGNKSNLDISKAIDRSYLLDKSKNFENSRSKINKKQVKQDKIKTAKVEVKDENHKDSKKDNQKSKENQKNTPSAIIIMPESPKKQKITPQINENQVTIKKQPSIATSNQQERFIRIQDYQVNEQKHNEPRSRNTFTSSRQRGSKILLRRSQNKSSRLERSAQSQRSEDRKSSKSIKKIKQSSLFGKTPKITVTNKNIQAQEQFLPDKNQINQTIEVNGNIVKEGAPTQKKKYTGKQQKELNKFIDGADSISSIHTNSVLRAFHNNAQKILDMTQNQGSEVKQEGNRYVKEEVANHIKKVDVPPVVGDYYQQFEKVERFQSPDITPKKKSYKKFNITEEALDGHKNYYARKETFKEISTKFVKEQQKIKDKIDRSKEEKPQERKSQRPNVSLKTETKIQRRSIKEKEAETLQQIKIKVIQSPKVENNKDRQIEELQKKIRQLQKETMLMKTKLAAKDNQIRSIKSTSKYGSERGFPQFTTLSQSHADRSERTSLRGSSVGKKNDMSNFQKQVQGQYKQYLQRIKGSTFRKSLLKLKCLVHKTDEIQIGCMSQRNDTNLQCTLYITPHRYSLIDFSIAILHDNCLKTKIVPDQIKIIHLKKQQKIHIVIETLKIPFCLPEIEINYKADSEYSSNYNRLTLPLCFSKFCDIKPLEADARSHKQLQYVRSDNFKLNNKIIKLDKIADSLPNFTIIPPNKQRQQFLLTANCRYLDSNFDIFLNLHDKNSFIEGFLKKGDIKPMNFLICTYRQILDGSKK